VPLPVIHIGEPTSRTVAADQAEQRRSPVLSLPGTRPCDRGTDWNLAAMQPGQCHCGAAGTEISDNPLTTDGLLLITRSKTLVSLIFVRRWEDVGAALGDGDHEASLAQRLHRTPGGVPCYAEHVDKILFGGQRVLSRAELSRLDPAAQPGRDLPVRRLCAPRVYLRHLHSRKLADQQQSSSLTNVGIRLATSR